RATAQFWKDLRRAALQAVHTGERINLGKISFAMKNGTLLMMLPSGRSVSYPKARLGPGKFEGTREIYFKDNAKGAWTECSSWYAKSSSRRPPENTTQGEQYQPQVGFSGVAEIPDRGSERTSDLPTGSESEHNSIGAKNDDDGDDVDVSLADLIGEPLSDGKI